MPAILLGTVFSTKDGLVPDVILTQELMRKVSCRWDGCFIRLLDGMLQAGALGSTDYQLRIPTKIRHLEILDAKPALPASSESESLPPAAPWSALLQSIPFKCSCRRVDQQGKALGK
jgi:hypothetical protein